MTRPEKAGQSQSSFSEEERASLAIIVDLIIPPSAEHDAPGAGDEAILADIVLAAEPYRSVLKDALLAFGAAGKGPRENVASTFRQTYPAEAEFLQSLTVQCYYRDARVMRSLGMEVRPPFPGGFSLEQGDWSLLDPVRARSAFYRKTS